MSHASMHYKYLQISRVCSLFNRRRRRPEDVDTRSRVRQRDKESRTVIRSMPSTRIRFHMCACTRGRCSDRMLSMHHVAAPSHEWILEWSWKMRYFYKQLFDTCYLLIFVFNSLIRLIWNYCYIGILIIVFIHFDHSNEKLFDFMFIKFFK